MFIAYHSNQLDILTEILITLIKNNPLTDPFKQEIILVQSSGISQWLQIKLAKKFNIAANIQFPFPSTFIWDMFRKVLPGIPQESAFCKEVMYWKLMWLLPTLLNLPILSPIKKYLNDDHNKQKIHQLSKRIAYLFDQYLVYRPEWLKHWGNGKLIDGLTDIQKWQAYLWQALVKYTIELKQPEWHLANLYQVFIKKLYENDKSITSLPKRVFILGISSLPPIYLQALRALSQHIDIHLMFTNPCRYFWSDMQNYELLDSLQSYCNFSTRRSSTLLSLKLTKSENKLFDVEDKININNPLLGSWGRLGRDYLHLLSQFDDLQEVHAFSDINPDNLLHTIQHDILELEDHSIVGNTIETLQHSKKKRLLNLQDNSINIHVCHSPQREVEVLQDQLLSFLEKDAALTVRDIIVMVADIDYYTPYIQAVFSKTNTTNTRYLPFAISDRKSSKVNPILQTFITLLDLPKSRFTAEQVLMFLEVQALAKKFDIHEEDLCHIRKWVKESGIRWGLDDDNVRQFSLTPTGQNTWKFGLTRMILGYAMDSKSGSWKGILPYDDSSGLSAELVGKLGEMLMQLSIWRTKLISPRTLLEWSCLCRNLLDTFFESNDDTEEILAFIEQQWKKNISYGTSAKYSDNVPITLLRDILITHFTNDRISQRFLAGSINFCTLMPMRSIPFDIVCLLGMNDGMYPRIVKPLSFDLMAKQIQKGDRNNRDDDRYLFLEALLSAGKKLYISYIGNSIRNNNILHPSVLVSELLEYIAQSYRLPGDKKKCADESARRVTEHILKRHTREPFASSNFFIGSEKQSYAAEWLPAAQNIGKSYPDLHQPLVVSNLTELTLHNLLSFYRHPIRNFFQLRLGVHFIFEESELSNEEPFILDNLARYKFNTILLNALIEKRDMDQFFARSKAEGIFPYESFGEIYFQNQLDYLIPLVQKIIKEKKQGYNFELNINLGKAKILGQINQVQTDGLLRWRSSTLTSIDGLLLWIEHLAYCLSGGKGESRIYGCQGTKWHFRCVSCSDAKEYLKILFLGYQKGMSQPLLLLHKSGWAWLQHCFNVKTGEICWDEKIQDKAKAKLLNIWYGNINKGISGECENPYIKRVLNVIDEQHLQTILQETERYLLPLALYNIA